MGSIKVLVYVESRYLVNRKRMKQAVADVLSTNSVTSPVEISLAVVGDRKMKSLNKQYRSLDKTTNVLSFPLMEGEQPSPYPSPKGRGNGGEWDALARLGDIVISYPQVIREAARDEVLVDDKIDELIKHSMLHLLGIHHQ